MLVEGSRGLLEVVLGDVEVQDGHHGGEEAGLEGGVVRVRVLIPEDLELLPDPEPLLNDPEVLSHDGGGGVAVARGFLPVELTHDRVVLVLLSVPVDNKTLREGRKAYRAKV